MAQDPAWLATARASLGLREAPGPANNATIIGWARKLGTKLVGMFYNADSVPWCGLFVAHCMAQNGLTPPPVPVRAKSWAEWGARLQFSRLSPGAVLVFVREGGGHVGFYVGEDATHFHVLGGNQGDCVSIARLPKQRCIAARWPRGVPVLGAPVKLTSAGAPVSAGEA
jgi:uncharacterized protein (TIGR02594 family)